MSESIGRFLVGSVMMAVSGTVLGISTFQYRPLLASAAVASFPITYSLAAGRLQSFRQSPKLSHAAGILAGSCIAGAGFVAGAKATSSLSISLIAASGLMVISGYFVCHESFVRAFLR